MPLTIRCEELQAGMRLYEPLIRANHVLLPAGRVLEPSDVQSLRKRYPNLEIRIIDPELDEKLPFEQDHEERQIAQAVKDRIMESIAKIDSRDVKRTSLVGVDLDEINTTVQELLDFIADRPVSTLLLSRSLDSETYLAERTGHVFYIAMVLASAARELLSKCLSGLGLPEEVSHPLRGGMISLGLGVMLMDIALTDNPELLQADRTLTFLEWDRVRAHPIEGTARLSDELPAMVHAIVRTHHENQAGTGFPHRLPGAKVPILSRIVRIADAYETATATGIHSRARTPVRTLWEMTQGPYRKYFDQDLTTIFARLIQPFPIGAKIQIEDGRYAVVVRFNHDDPFQPIGVIAFDHDGQRLPSRHLKDPTPLGPRSGIRLKSFQDEDLLFLYGVGITRESDHLADSTETLFKLLYP